MPPKGKELNKQSVKVNENENLKYISYSNA
jgi:hypothetical protein